MTGAALVLRGSFTFASARLFDKLTLTLPVGEWTCLLGRSGIGKSTLLRLLAGLTTGGNFDGQIRMHDGSDAPAAVAYMAQSDLLAPWLSVRENVILGSRLRGQTPDFNQADDLIARVGLARHSHKRPNQLSGGMRQRAALARTLMEQAPLVLLDEPFSALDARTRADMQELAFELLRDATVLLATHDPAEAARLAHQIVIMSSDGLRDWPVPSNVPIRATDDTAMLQAQARLLSELRAGEPVLT